MKKLLAVLLPLVAVSALLDSARPSAYCPWCSWDWRAAEARLEAGGVADPRARARMIDVLRQREPEHTRRRRELDAMGDSLSRSGLRPDQLPLLAPAAFGALVDAQRRLAALESEISAEMETAGRERPLP
jgi:hypothetical protein